LKEERRNPMALLERVATLIRANLNDLIDKAEDPEKMIKAAAGENAGRDRTGRPAPSAQKAKGK
jgi:hypothetical protein